MEFDDAYQEGMLCVVFCLQEGTMPPPGEEAETKIERWLRAEVRKLNRQVKGDLDVPFTYGGGKQSPAAIDVRDALSDLPPELLTVVLLRHYFGFEWNEIAAITGRSRATCFRQEGDARLKLRRRLA
jgi:DNA-directed RNA polymerase specialized sigma24 family protein